MYFVEIYGIFFLIEKKQDFSKKNWKIVNKLTEIFGESLNVIFQKFLRKFVEILEKLKRNV